VGIGNPVVNLVYKGSLRGFRWIKPDPLNESQFRITKRAVSAYSPGDSVFKASLNFASVLLVIVGVFTDNSTVRVNHWGSVEVTVVAEFLVSDIDFDKEADLAELVFRSLLEIKEGAKIGIASDKLSLDLGPNESNTIHLVRVEF
jgi:hypothetical protein